MLQQHCRLLLGTASHRGKLLRAILPRRSLTSGSPSDHPPHVQAGMGFGKVQDRMLKSVSGLDLYQHCSQPHTCSIIGAPMTYGQPYVGTDSGPALLREKGLRNMLSALGWRVEDLPDLDFETINTTTSNANDNNYYNSNAKNSHIVGAGCRQLADLVQSKLEQGRFPLVLGGDHSIGIGSLSGVLRARPETGVLWIDAHADLNTPAISESGNLHGMPVGLLMKGVDDANSSKDPTASSSHENIPGLEWVEPLLKPDSIVYIGLRDVDNAERHLIRKLGIAAFTMHDIDRHGIGQVMDRALHHLLAAKPDRPLHISYDIDAVDPVLAPATGTTVRGGLTFREAHYVAEAAANSGNLASAEIVELNPTLVKDETLADDTVELGLQIVTSLMGKSII